ncbi:MAG TPA: hypothetical protein VFT98_04850 [Myxococcota bacterium]|nr:hypothetical protein [Myxococcota bacterium]
MGAVLALALAACGGDEESGNYAESSPQSDDSTEVAAESDADAEAEADRPRTLVDPVNFKALIDFLPAAPSGWTAGEPNGSTTAMGDYKVTTVSNSYRSAASDGGAEQSVTAEITDGGFAEMVAAPFTMMSQFSSETTQGYQKGVTVEGQPGYEDWNTASRSSNLNVLVANRFLIHLSGSGLEPEALREWLAGMKIDELMELAGES